MDVSAERRDHVDLIVILDTRGHSSSLSLMFLPRLPMNVDKFLVIVNRWQLIVQGDRLE